jgi:regulator of replication initiation timing
MPGKRKKTAQEYEAEIKALKEENLRLTIENEYIKKLSALVSEREKSQKKKSQQ